MRLPSNSWNECMKRSRKPSGCKLSRLDLLPGTSTGYGRRILRGRAGRVRLHRPWEFSVPPGPFEQALPGPNTRRGDGMMAGVRSPKMVLLVPVLFASILAGRVRFVILRQSYR